MYEVYHFAEQSKDLFRTYIDRFLKVKQEASGWPAHCITETEKKNYIEEYKRIEAIVLDYENICKNPGKRQVAKLALNAFWGR